MCGICCVLQIHHDGQDEPPISLEKTKIYESIQRRGPDCCNSLRKALNHIDGHSCHVNGLFCGAVLHQRGKLTPQPLQDDVGNLLLWNGEIFAGIEVGQDENDGLVLLDLLKACPTDGQILRVLGQIRGPWSFVYWQEREKQLWFGRDVFGRRSLLWRWQAHSSHIGGTLTVSSVACRPADTTGIWEEIPAHGIYCIELAKCTPHHVEMKLYPWQRASSVETGEVLSHGASYTASPDGANKLQMQESLSAKKVLCDRIAESPIRISQCPLGIINPIVPLNKTIPEDKDSVLWQFSMEQIRADKPVTKSMEHQHQDFPLSNSDKGSKVGEGLNLVKQGTDLVEQISLEPKITDLFVKLEGQLRKHAQDLIDILGQAVCRRVHNLPRQKSTSGCDDTENRTKHHKDGVDISEKVQNCFVRCGSSVVVDFKEDLHAMSRTDHDRTAFCLSQTGNSRCDDVNPPGSSMKIASHPNPGVCANQTGSTRQEQLHQQFGKPQLDRCRWSQTGSGFGCHGDARVAILFSGGIDSMVLAVLADRYVPKDEPIDLLNVAFQQVIKVNTSKNKTKNKHGQETKKDDQQTQFTYDVPDRITGRSGLDELRQINPHRRWNFVEINVTLDELRAMRSSRVSDLVYPLQSVLDDSIGCAIWFAARGQGNLISSDSHQHGKEDASSMEHSHVPYTSPAKVVLVGMGADEQLAGYSRHRGKFQSGGWEGLVAEMEMEVQRISSRNLGRDDRIISDHSRESRLPYLDEDVVNFLQQLPVWIKTDLTLPRGLGEKMLLRVAARQLGLTDSAILPKRAIQFGSRIAKMENSNEKASDVCGRLK